MGEEEEEEERADTKKGERVRRAEWAVRVVGEEEGPMERVMMGDLR